MDASTAPEATKLPFLGAAKDIENPLPGHMQTEEVPIENQVRIRRVTTEKIGDVKERISGFENDPKRNSGLS